MIDKEQINLRLKKLNDYLGILEHLQKYSVEEIEQDELKRGSLERYLQLAAEACIDIGEIIIAEKNFRSPEDSYSVFTILKEEKVLPEDFADRFAPVA